MQLTQLTTLCIYTPRIDASNFHAFCSAMCGLEELWLQSWDQEDIRSISSADLAPGFAALHCLHTLKFDNSFDEATLAPVLHCAPALRHLFIPQFEPGHDPVLLAQLVQAAPQLEVHLEAQSDCDSLAKAQLALQTKRTHNPGLVAAHEQQDR